jgi:succinate dehydrogenase / fumarate reductase cytochrome b subunit
LANSNRPLSPHLQIYRRTVLLPMLSITHRITGCGIALAAILIPAVLAALATGPEAYTCVQAHLSAWYGQLALVLISASLIFHSLNGIRHLVWDTGQNLEVRNAEKSGYAVIVLTILLTAALWLYLCQCHGRLL